jgi:hypothetical protein
MVKKIRIIEDDSPPEELSTTSYQDKMLAYQQAIDWKLWELLKIAQAFAEREGLSLDAQSPTKSTTNVKSIIVDED